MIKLRKHITGLLILLSLIYSVSGQDIKITSVFDSARIYIGDQIGFTVTIDKPDGLNLQLPLFKDTIVKALRSLVVPKLTAEIMDE
jgi:hypothetical protein